MDIYSRIAWWVGVGGILMMVALAALMAYPLLFVDPVTAGDTARGLFPGNYGSI